MNVSDLMRGLIGNLRATHSHSLQLKVGDVVKGTVVKVLSNDQALVNINGTIINAKLETPLQRGDVTMLQVQPESGQGLIVLKPLGASQVAITSESLATLLKQFGLNNTPSERMLLQQMHLAGLPLTKENVVRLAPVLSMINEQAAAPQMIQSAIIALQRGLPITEQSLGALQQVLFGQPIDRLASTLLQNLMQFSTAPSTTGHSGQGAQASTQQLLGQLQHQLQQVITTGWQGISQSAQASTTGNVQQNLPGNPSQAQAQVNSQQSQPLAGPAVQVGSSAPVHSSAQPQANAQAQQQITTNFGLSAATPTDSQASIAQSAAQPASAEQGQIGGAAHLASMGITTEATAPSQNTGSANWISNMLKLLGINHEQLTASLGSRASMSGGTELQQQASQPQASQPQASAAGQQAQGSSQAKQAQTTQTGQSAQTGQVQASATQGGHSQGLTVHGLNEAQHNQVLGSTASTQAPQLGQAQSAPPAILLDNVKSLLLQLNQVADLPQAVRDSAQQLLQHITGQQLFLSTDRSSHFAHMTLFIPLYDENGGQTAAINIQSRKGQHGGLDPKNCRMVFDLNMQHLGETLIDVNVTNKIVSLQMHNDHPMIGQLLEEGRASIHTALQDIGYQLSSLTHTPFPSDSEPSQAEDAPSNVAASLLSRSSIYNVKPYKGLDVRI